jgi:teichuronic acid exporter
VSIARKAARGGMWFAGFKLLTQMLSWGITIIVARLLAPQDYGLMSVASIFTGYVEIFSELGLGAAIVQRAEISQQEYSSNFWFSIMTGVAFSAVAFGLAYPTAWAFHEPRAVRITQLISVLFVIGALGIVPFNMLMRNLQFKAVGFIQLCAVAISSSAMLWMAYAGYGVWTLISGTLILRTLSVIGVFAISRWRPSLHFRWSEVRQFLRFGLNVAGARSLFYVFQKSDVFVIERLLGIQALGYYAFAMQLASTPNDKIVTLVNQVSFPVFARFQKEPDELRALYLRTTNYLSIVLAPLYLSGALWGDVIIRTILGERWVPIIFLFRILCVSQLFTSFNAINNAIHTAVGRSQWVIYFHVVAVTTMPAALYVAASHGLDAVAVPWLVVYPAICVCWTWLTLRALGVGVTDYLKSVGVPLLASVAIVGLVTAVTALTSHAASTAADLRLLFAANLALGGLLYGLYLWVCEREALATVWSLRRA